MSILPRTGLLWFGLSKKQTLPLLANPWLIVLSTILTTIIKSRVEWVVVMLPASCVISPQVVAGGIVNGNSSTFMNLGRYSLTTSKAL